MGACQLLTHDLWLWGWHPESHWPHLSQRFVSGAGIRGTLPEREAGPASQRNIRLFSWTKRAQRARWREPRAGRPSRLGWRPQCCPPGSRPRPACPSRVLSGLQLNLLGLLCCPVMSPMFWLLWLKVRSTWNVPETELSLRPGGPTSGKSTFSANKSTAS